MSARSMKRVALRSSLQSAAAATSLVFGSLGIAVCLSGCWLVAAGAGAEAGYVLTQENRTPAETMEDQRITAAVKGALVSDREVSGFDINVDTMRSRVTLKGVVDTAREAERAVELARAVSGVRGVESKLVVLP